MKSIEIDQMRGWLTIPAKRDSVEFDFHGSWDRETKIVFKKKDLKHSCSESKHLNLRVLQGKKAGTSYTKDFSKAGLEECYQQAFNSLKLSDKEEVGDVSPPAKYMDFSAFYDKDLESVSLKEKLEKAREINSVCADFDKRAQPALSSVSDSSFFCFFANSRGTQSSYRGNFVSSASKAFAVEGKSRATAYSIQTARNYKGIDFKKIGRESASRAIKKLNYSIPKTGKYPVIFQAEQASASLLTRLAGQLSGKAVFEGESLFKDSLGKKVFSDQFSLYDEPLALWGRGSSPFDGEGFPVEKTPLAEKGCLSNYLTSSFYAKALKAPHTKKAAWRGDGSLGVSAFNLSVPAGDSSFEELVGEFPETLVIDNLKGFAGYNEISGDFSIESEGFLWKGGEARPLCQFTVSGNIKKVFADILKTGKDLQVYNGFVQSPSFLLPELIISGK